MQPLVRADKVDKISKIARWAKPQHKYQLGATLVELAIVIVLLVLILLGMIDFGRALRRIEILTNAAKEGARVAASWSLLHDQVGGSQYKCGRQKLPCEDNLGAGTPLTHNDCAVLVGPAPLHAPNLACVAVREALRYLESSRDSEFSGSNWKDNWNFFVRFCTRTEPLTTLPDMPPSVQVDMMEFQIVRRNPGITWSHLIGADFESGSAAFSLARECQWP